MNQRRRRPLKLHLRAAPDPKQKVLYRSSPKVPLKAILAGIFLALIMIGALSFAAFTVLKNARLKRQEHAAVASPSPSASAALAGSVNPVPTSIDAPRVASISATPTPTPTPSATPPATPVLRPTALVANGTPREAKSPTEVTRKSAEQRRREAEHKRARLEKQYKNHEISEDAYKKGQEEYQAEMAKYRTAVSGTGSSN